MTGTKEEKLRRNTRGQEIRSFPSSSSNEEGIKDTRWREQGRASEEPERIMCPNKHLERRTAREREREVRARVGENKGDKHGDRQRTRSILCPGSTQREQPHVRVK